MALLLVDGDIIRYRCGFAAERTEYMVPEPDTLIMFSSIKEAKDAGYTKEDLWSRKKVQPLGNCLQIVKEAIQGIEREFNGLDFFIYFSGKENFRDKLAYTWMYKGNRKGKEKPVYFDDIYEYLYKNYPCRTGLGEADDEISIDAHKGGYRDIIVSNDKDLDQIPGDHYNWVTKEKYSVSKREAKTRFFIQLISGDQTDNVPGLLGYGEAKATKALQDCTSPRDMLEVCWALYKEKGHDLAYFTEQANLVYLLKEPETWWSRTEEGKKFIGEKEQEKQVEAIAKRPGAGSP